MRNYYNHFNNNFQPSTQSSPQQFNYNSNSQSENNFYQKVASSTTVIPFQRQAITEKPYNPYDTAIQQQKSYQNNQYSTTVLPQNIQKQTTSLYNSDEPIIEVFKVKTTKSSNFNNNKNNLITTTSNYNIFNNNYNNKQTDQSTSSNFINNNNNINNNHFNKQTTQIPVNRQSTQTTFKNTSEQPKPNFYNTNYDSKASSQVANNFNPTTQAKQTEINYKQYQLQNQNKNYNNDYNDYKQFNQNQVQRSTTPIPIDISPSTYNPQRHSPQSVINSSPRGFSQNPSFNIPNVPTTKKSNTDKYQTVSRTNENYTPSTVKKFSTLVPKESYNPTTFKPGTYKKNFDISTPKFILPEYTPKQVITTSTTTTLPPPKTTTNSPPKFLVQTQNLNIDEDDGQYHPELYEKDFARNKLKQRPANRQQQYYNNHNNNQNNYNNFQTTTVSYQSSEDEFLKTAHSINIAASGNEIRAEKARQASPRPFSKAPTIPPNATSTKKSPTKDKDASYDYAYYDSGNSKDYSEYDLIEDFGKTKRNGKSKN